MDTKKVDTKKIWTPLHLLHWIEGYFLEKSIGGARLEAEELLAFALDLRRIDLYLYGDRPCEPQELARLHQLVKQRVCGMPLAYLIGKTSFSFLEFAVSSAVLIPRSDSERLLEVVLEQARILQQTAGHSPPLRILELGTGCGNLALSLACSLSGLRIDALELCVHALAVAEQNKASIADQFPQVQQSVNMILSDKFAAIPAAPHYDIIFSNPPYLADTEESEYGKGLAHEPDLALYAGENGLEFYAYFAGHAAAYLKPGGTLCFEHGYQQRAAIREIFEAHSNIWQESGCYEDINGQPRVLRYRKRAQA